jgi:regulator of protease activity HflC (stomatin/prohibitin superfamily)
MAQPPQWEGLRMRLLIELPLTIAFFTLAVKYGWPYTIIFVLGYILAFALRLTYLSRRTQVSTRFLVFLGIFLAFAMTASMIIGRFFFSANGQAWIEASRIWTFLLVTPALKVLWAAVIGFGLTAIVAMLILLPYGYSVAQNIYSQYEQYKGHEKEAVAAAIGAFLGISRGTWIVSNGQAEARGDPGGSLARFGGPGVLIVQEGHAVILEKSGRLSRVVGRGITWLQAFERISMVVPLSGRAERITVEQVATKDKVLIEEFAVLVFHKIDPGPEDERIQDGQFEYTEQKLFKDVWSPGGDDWRKTVQSIADGAVRDVVGRYDLEELMPMSEESRDRFKEELRQTIDKVTSGALGVQTTSVDIGSMKIPEEARKRLLEKWLAVWRIPVAESEKDVAILKSEGEAKAAEIKARSDEVVEQIKAQAQREVAKIEREKTTIQAESTIEKAKAQAEAEVIRGRARAESKAELLRRVRALEPAMDVAALTDVLKGLRTDEQLEAMSRIILAAERGGGWGEPQGVLNTALGLSHEHEPSKPKTPQE